MSKKRIVVENTKVFFHNLDDYIPIIIRSFSEPQFKGSKFDNIFAYEKEASKEDQIAQKEINKSGENLKTKDTKPLKDKTETLIAVTSIKSPKDQKEGKAIKQVDVAIVRKSTLKTRTSIDTLGTNEEKRQRTSTLTKKDPKEKEEQSGLNPKETISAPNVLERASLKKLDEENSLDKNKLDEDKISKLEKGEKQITPEESKETTTSEENKQDDVIIKWCSICDLIVITSKFSHFDSWKLIFRTRSISVVRITER